MNDILPLQILAAISVEVICLILCQIPLKYCQKKKSNVCL